MSHVTIYLHANSAEEALRIAVDKPEAIPFSHRTYRLADYTYEQLEAIAAVNRTVALPGSTSVVLDSEGSGTYCVIVEDR